MVTEVEEAIKPIDARIVKINTTHGTYLAYLCVGAVVGICSLERNQVMRDIGIVCFVAAILWGLTTVIELLVGINDHLRICAITLAKIHDQAEERGARK